jgi:hypothetical protein
MITLRTHYPHELTCKLNVDDESRPGHHSFFLEWVNRDTRKINNIEILFYLTELLKDIDPTTMNKDADITFSKDFFSLEHIRDVFCNRIDELIDDTSPPSIDKLGAFGNIDDPDKPLRLVYWNLCKKYPESFEMNITRPGGIKKGNYSFDTENVLFMTLIELKKYKYVLDIPGHPWYSTKIGWKLFMKRPVFFCFSAFKFEWEKELEPFVHYIPVKDDLSDLRGQFLWAEENPVKCQEIMEAGYNFACENLTKDKIKEKFKRLISL